MAFLSGSIFQPPTPSVIELIPARSAWHWLLRLILLTYTVFFTFPIILMLVPGSVILGSSRWTAMKRLAPLPIHPDNLPFYKSYLMAILRGCVIYCASGFIWSITAIGAPPLQSEASVRKKVYASAYANDEAADRAERKKGIRGSRGQRGRLEVSEMRIRHLEERYMLGVVRDVYRELREEKEQDIVREEQNAEGVLGFWMINRAISADPRDGARKGRQDVPKVVKHVKEVLSQYRHPISPVRIVSESISPSTPLPSTSPGMEPSALRPNEKREQAPSCTDRKVYLFFSGGGYVTGHPLSHAAIHSLVRTFEPEAGPLDLNSALPRGAVFAPNIRKALSFADAFPMPLVDALSAYAFLIKIGYEPSEIVLIGNSAGGGMAWSVLAYLCCLYDSAGPAEHLGVPGGIIMNSPWLALPPIAAGLYPDLVDAPQTLNAARSYLARFPVLPARPDPFGSEWPLWREAFKRLFTFSAAGAQVDNAMRSRVIHIEDGKNERNRSDTSKQDNLIDGTRKYDDSEIDVELSGKSSMTLRDWLNKRHFAKLTSHHPLVSPCSAQPGQTTSISPFVHQVLRTAARRNVKMLMVSGTAEWFHGPAQRLPRAAAEAGMRVTVEEEVGGVHCEDFISLAEHGGAGKRLLDSVLAWTGESETLMRVGADAV